MHLAVGIGLRPSRELHHDHVSDLVFYSHLQMRLCGSSCSLMVGSYDTLHGVQLYAVKFERLLSVSSTNRKIQSLCRSYQFRLHFPSTGACICLLAF
jgi:hypothetical protein